MSSLTACCTRIIHMIDHALRPAKHTPTAGVDPLDARTRWTQQGPFDELRSTVPGPPPPMEPRFEAVWEAIKHWDISRGDEGDLCDRMYAGATGDDVRTILAALDAARPYDDLAFPLTEAVTGADYWRARCELAEEDADRLYTFTNPDRPRISPAVVEWVRNQHLDAVHYRTAARDRLVAR